MNQNTGISFTPRLCSLMTIIWANKIFLYIFRNLQGLDCARVSAVLQAEAGLGLGDSPDIISLSLLTPGGQSLNPLFTATRILEKIHILLWFGGRLWASAKSHPVVLVVCLRYAPLTGPGLAEIIFAAREFIICYIWPVFFSSFPSFFCIFPHPLPLTVGCPPSTFSPPGTYINRQISVGSENPQLHYLPLVFF